MSPADTAIEVAARRLAKEEGVRRYAYNDATGKRVTCQPYGNLSIAIGVNLENGLDDEEIEWLLRHRLGIVETSLHQHTWYMGLDAARASVLLDLGYNNGVPGLLDYRRMLAAVDARNWITAQAELLDSKAARDLPGRYQFLGQILLTGIV